jgi:hypothetical protein
MRIQGLDNLTRAELEQELATGGRFVFFEFCISFVVVTLRCPTRIVFLRAGDLGFIRGLPYTFLSLLLGWWGVPWGIIYTPLTLLTNLSGGRDVTEEVRELLRKGALPVDEVKDERIQRCEEP